jgi:hypothetical protein
MADIKSATDRLLQVVIRNYAQELENTDREKSLSIAALHTRGIVKKREFLKK